MINELYKNRYRTASSRLSWHNYNMGCYYVTICTKNMEYYFGNISGKQMILSEIGSVAEELILLIPQNYPGVEVLSYVVMPNHIHIIIHIHEEENKSVSINNNETLFTALDKNAPKHEGMQEIALHQGKLSKVINHFKGAVTKHARSKGIPFAWLPRFYDEIIRDDESFDNIKRYIESNVERWCY